MGRCQHTLFDGGRLQCVLNDDHRSPLVAGTDRYSKVHKYDPDNPKETKVAQVQGDYERNVQGDGEQQALFDWGAVPDEKMDRVKALSEWLGVMRDKEQSETLRKAVEYGSSDLEVMGKAMLMLQPEHLRSEVLGLQMAIGFYALGKVARLFGAFEDGRSPSADTWYDLHIYALMGLKVQETGRWL